MAVTLGSALAFITMGPSWWSKESIFANRFVNLVRRDLNLIPWRMVITATLQVKEQSSGVASKWGKVMGARYPLGKTKQVQRDLALSIHIQMDPAWAAKQKK